MNPTSAGMIRTASQATNTSALHATLHHLRRLGRDKGDSVQPGVDPQQANAHLMQRAVQTYIADYSHDQMTCKVLHNAELVDWAASQAVLGQENGMAEMEWHHATRVRFIATVLSWDVLQALSLMYELHPLVVEDILDGDTNTRSKVDYFSGLIFFRLQYMHVGEEVQLKTKVKIDPEKSMDGHLLRVDAHSSLIHAKTSSESVDQTAHEHNLNMVSELTESKYKVKVQTTPVSLLTIGGTKDTPPTVIVIFQNDCANWIPSLMDRLHDKRDILRTSNDPGMLLHANLDAIVDAQLHMVEHFRKELIALQADVHISVHFDNVKDLHLFSTQLTLLRQTLTPFEGVILHLRERDADRCRLADQAPSASAGRLSHRTRMFLRDVEDHMSLVMSSLEQFSQLSDALISYSFNTLAYRTNDSMKILALLSCLFLPITAVSGYFGQNFTSFSAINGSVSLFFKVSMPMVGILLIVLCWPLFFEYLGALRKVWHRQKVRRLQARHVKMQ